MASQQVPTRVISSDGTFEAYLKLQENEAEIYEAIEIDGKLSRAWTVSKTGMTFSIHLDCKPLAEAASQVPDGKSYDEFLCTITIDSKQQGNGGTITRFSAGHGQGNLYFLGTRASATEMYPFRFAPTHEVLDNHTERLDKSIADLVGTIRMEIRRVRRRGASTDDRVHSRPSTLDHMNEEEKKAKLPNIAGFAKPIRVPKRSSCKTRTHPDYKDTPYYAFELCYRTTDVLKAMGVIGDPTKEKVDSGSDKGGIIDLDAPVEGTSESDSALEEEDEDGDEGSDAGEDESAEMSLEQRLLQAEMEALEARGRELRAQMEASQKDQADGGAGKKKGVGKKRKIAAVIVGSDNQEDKDKILRQMGKRLKKKQKTHGSMVDLTLDG